MNVGIYRLKLGEFDCISISDGSINYPLGSFFANVPRKRVEEALRRLNLPTEYITTPCTCLLVNTNQHRVLVDTGAGSTTASTGRLLRRIKMSGIRPEDIDIVIITHAHPDQIGGVLNKAGKPIYANAHYFICRDEYNFWTSEKSISRAPERHVICARKNLGVIRDQIILFEGEFEILPGVLMVAAPGHTPGHMLVSLSSGDEQFIYISDMVLHPLHLEHPDWISIYDIMPEEAATTKYDIFDRIVAEEAMVLGAHFTPFPSLGYIVKKKGGWQWRPIERRDGKI
jgi:glyoxylase-like metal-dependent hydrolase (beta-lactamase superfamily II)